MSQGRTEEALGAYDEALAIHREVGSRRYEGRALGNLATLRLYQGRVDEALVLFEQALCIACETGNRAEEGAWLCNLGLLHYERDHIDEASRLFEAALAIASETRNRHLEGIALGNLAQLYPTLGRPEEARALFDRALTISRAIGHREHEGFLLGALASLELLVSGDLIRAEDLVRVGEVALSGAGAKQELAGLACIRGHIALAGTYRRQSISAPLNRSLPRFAQAMSPALAKRSASSPTRRRPLIRANPSSQAFVQMTACPASSAGFGSTAPRRSLLR